MSTALNLGAWRDRTNLYAPTPHATKPQGIANTALIASYLIANHIHITLQAAANQAALEAMTHTAKVPACWALETATAMRSSRWTCCLHAGSTSRTT
jgi:hypothetical protein